jgi:hypothetical protein
VPIARLHRLNFGPEELPPTSPLDLKRAWRAAHMGAEIGLVMAPGDIEGIGFRGKSGEETIFMFADLDAACWAAAVDRAYGLETTNGVSLLFRLLALIALMSEARWLQAYFSLSGKDGATLNPALLATAASQPLTRTAAFDARAFKVAMGLETEGKIKKPEVAAIAAPRTAQKRQKAKR